MDRNAQKGDLLNWDESEWELVNMVQEEEDIPESDLCGHPKTLWMFPQAIEFWKAVDLSQRMGSEMAAPPRNESEKNAFALVTDELSGGISSQTL